MSTPRRRHYRGVLPLWRDRDISGALRCRSLSNIGAIGGTYMSPVLMMPQVNRGVTVPCAGVPSRAC